MTTRMNVSQEQHQLARTITIEFLFLDLTTCTRCVGTQANLEIALQLVKQKLEQAHITVALHHILIDSEEKVRQYRFVTSPTIRINGRDIALETRESRCDSCTDLCDCAEGIDCRVWIYNDQEYTQAPVEMIVNALSAEAFQSHPSNVSELVTPITTIPENLQRFFAARAIQAMSSATVNTTMCCSVDEQQRCCESAAKPSCCGSTPYSGGCGCK